MDGATVKTCRKCGLDRPHYRRTGRAKHLLQSCCTSCWGVAQAERDIAKYGLSVGQYEALYEKTFGCAICGTPNDNGKRLAVDHCHVTGRVRGVLCSPCNMALGGLRDDVKLFERAIEYLKEDTDGRTIPILACD